MTALVIMAGILAVFSGIVKLFGRSRIPGVVPLLPVLEALGGSGALFFYLSQGSTPAVGTWVIFTLLGLVLISSIQHVRKASARRRLRENTEGGRLAAYVRYTSVQEDPDSKAPPSPEQGQLPLT